MKRDRRTTRVVSKEKIAVSLDAGTTAAILKLTDNVSGWINELIQKKLGVKK